MGSNEVNIFMTLRMEQNEVVMCRFLADLLDPRGWHKCEARFLESFLEEVVGLKGMKNLERTSVMTEYLIDSGRRIDIMLLHPAFAIPIEAKINAGDQRSQCYDYHFYVRNAKAKLVYLTKTGDPPSKWSITAKDGAVLSGEKVHPVSWRKICDWLEKAGDSDWLKGKPETAMLVRQYLKAIQSFLPKTENETRQPDRDLVHDVLEAFRNEMDKGRIAGRYGLEVLEVSPGSYSEQVWTNRSLTFCPGLNYRVKSADFPQKEGLQMLFRIEVSDDGYLCAGFCLVNTKEGRHGEKVKVNDDAIDAVQGVGDFRFIISRDDWWFVWRFSNGKQDVSQNDVPNFKTMNERAARLDKLEEREKFVKETIQIFEDQLLGYLLKPSDERSHD